jgi:hypothetical protein
MGPRGLVTATVIAGAAAGRWVLAAGGVLRAGTLRREASAACCRQTVLRHLCPCTRTASSEHIHARDALPDMADVQAAAAKELALVGKVEMRIALAGSDKKLEDLLKTYLAPLLLKLGSEHAAVRNKVISVCQHISTRIKSQYACLPPQPRLWPFTLTASAETSRCPWAHC